MAQQYLTKQNLERMVRESQALGTLTDELVAALTAIAKGIGKRWKYDRDFLEEAVQNLCVTMLEKLHTLDATKNLFSYFTTCLRNEVFHLHRQRVQSGVKWQRLVEHQIREGVYKHEYDAMVRRRRDRTEF